MRAARPTTSSTSHDDRTGGFPSALLPRSIVHSSQNTLLSAAFGNYETSLDPGLNVS